MTQAAQLIEAIRRAGAKGMTYGDLEALKISTCPWKRLDPDEKPERWLYPGERLARQEGENKLIHFVIEKAQ